MPTVAASPALAIPNAPMRPMNAALAAQRTRLCRTTTDVGEGAAWLEVPVIGFLSTCAPAISTRAGQPNLGQTIDPCYEAGRAGCSSCASSRRFASCLPRGPVWM